VPRAYDILGTRKEWDKNTNKDMKKKENAIHNKIQDFKHAFLNKISLYAKL
jgi:hypothetical protein